MRGVYYLRVELLDNVYLPLSNKPTETSLIEYLGSLCRTLWESAYQDVEFRPNSTRHQSGVSRSCAPLHLKLRDWYNIDKASSDLLQLSNSLKKGLWIRMAVELWNLQKNGFIREAIIPDLKGGGPAGSLLTKEAFENSVIEFRYFSVLLWLYAFRNRIAQNQASKSALISAAKNEFSPRATRPRSISDGLLDAVSFNGTASSIGSPRKDPNNPSDLDNMVKDTFTESLFTIFCLIGFHHDAAIEYITNGIKATDCSLLAQHLRYIALIIQLKQVQDNISSSRRVPSGSTVFESSLFRELNHLVADDLPNIPIVKLASHLKSSIYLATVDVSLCSAMNRSRAKLQAMRRHRSSASEHLLVSGKRKEVLLLPVGGQTAAIIDLSIVDCHSCTIITMTRYRSLRISSCTKCMIVLPAVGASISIIHCSNTDVHAAAVSIVIINCYDTQLFAASVTPPIVAGDSRDIALAPYNVMLADQRQWMRQCSFDLTPAVVGAFHETLHLPLVNAGGRASTPREDAEQNVRLLKPSEFSLMILPTHIANHLITDEERTKQQNSLVIPYQYATELELRNQKKTEMLRNVQRLTQGLTPKEFDLFTKRTDARFQEWLQRTMPKIYNLSQESN